MRTRLACTIGLRPSFAAALRPSFAISPAASKIMQSEFSGVIIPGSVLILETRPSASGSPAGGGEPCFEPTATAEATCAGLVEDLVAAREGGVATSWRGGTAPRAAAGRGGGGKGPVTRPLAARRGALAPATAPSLRTAARVTDSYGPAVGRSSAGWVRPDALADVPRGRCGHDRVPGIFVTFARSDRYRDGLDTTRSDGDGHERLGDAMRHLRAHVQLQEGEEEPEVRQVHGRGLPRHGGSNSKNCYISFHKAAIKAAAVTATAAEPAAELIILDKQLKKQRLGAAAQSSAGTPAAAARVPLAPHTVTGKSEAVVIAKATVKLTSKIKVLKAKNKALIVERKSLKHSAATMKESLKKERARLYASYQNLREHLFVKVRRERQELLELRALVEVPAASASTWRSVRWHWPPSSAR